MQLKENRKKDAVVVEVEGKIDGETAPLFEEQCRSIVKRGGKRFFLDLRKLAYLSSAGLRSLVKLAKELAAGDGELALCAPQQFVNEVLGTSGVSGYIPIYSSTEEALAEEGADSDDGPDESETKG